MPIVLRFITKSDRYYCNIRQLLYYKMWQKVITKCVRIFITNVTVLLQNATVATNCDDFITKCDSYYKMWRSLQIATVHPRSDTFFSILNILRKRNAFSKNVLCLRDLRVQRYTKNIEHIHSIIFHSARVEVANKFLLAKSYQYIGNFN